MARLRRLPLAWCLTVLAAFAAGAAAASLRPDALAAPPDAAGEESAAAEAPEASVPGGRIFELRTYHCASGRLPNLHARFRDHTNWLFVKHGMTLVGYWTPVDRPDTLTYMLAYPDRKARERSWKAFLEDPEWKEVFAASRREAGGPIVEKVDSTFLRPTDYSPMR